MDNNQPFIASPANFNVYAAGCKKELHPQLLYDFTGPT